MKEGHRRPEGGPGRVGPTKGTRDPVQKEKTNESFPQRRPREKECRYGVW